MDPKIAHRVLEDPDFQNMARRKSRLGWSFSAMMFAVYVAFILFIGASPETFGETVTQGGVITWGIYAGLFVILFAFAITGIYVHKANGEFETMTRNVVRKVEEEEK